MMRVELGMARDAGGTATADEKLRLIRHAMTSASSKYGINGRLKERHQVKPVTLPALKLPPLVEDEVSK